MSPGVGFVACLSLTLILLALVVVTDGSKVVARDSFEDEELPTSL